MTNLFAAVQGYFDQAAERIGLDDGARQVLSGHRRETAVQVRVRMDNGATVTAERFDLLLGAELEQVHHEVGTARFRSGAFSTAVRLFSSMVKNDSFDEFLTLPAYQLLP